MDEERIKELWLAMSRELERKDPHDEWPNKEIAMISPWELRIISRHEGGEDHESCLDFVREEAIREEDFDESSLSPALLKIVKSQTSDFYSDNAYPNVVHGWASGNTLEEAIEDMRKKLRLLDYGYMLMDEYYYRENILNCDNGGWMLVEDEDYNDEEDDEDEEDFNDEDEEYDDEEDDGNFNDDEEEDEGDGSAIEEIPEDIAKKLLDDMVHIPAGTFMMGSPASELGRMDDAHEAQHQVTLTQDFYIGKYPVTQELWEAVTGENPSKFKGANHPVDSVSWEEALKFCKRLNRPLKARLPEGFHFDLPTEAQWEYACRAGTTSALNNGEELTAVIGKCSNVDAIAWYRENSGNTTHDVGQKMPNAWGLYDMHGNVWEWCRDGYCEVSKESAIDPVDLENETRVNRGGSYNCVRSVRAAHRNRRFQLDHDSGTGFRLALVPGK